MFNLSKDKYEYVDESLIVAHSCNRCETIKNILEFSCEEVTYCKECCKIMNSNHRDSMRGKLLAIYNAIENEIIYKLSEVKTFFNSVTHYLQRGLYYQQIKELYKWFPKQNILILLSEEVKTNMENEYNRVYHFLNLRQLENVSYNTHFESDSKDNLNPALYNKLKIFFINDVKKLEKLINMETNWF